MVRVDVCGGVGLRTVSKRLCFSLTYPGVVFCGDTARANVESVAQAPHNRRVELLLRKRSGVVI